MVTNWDEVDREHEAELQVLRDKIEREDTEQRQEIAELKRKNASLEAQLKLLQSDYDGLWEAYNAVQERNH